MSEFPYHTTAAIARGERVSIESLRYLSCLAKAYYDKWRHNDRQRIDDIARIAALEAECALLKEALLGAEWNQSRLEAAIRDAGFAICTGEMTEDGYQVAHDILKEALAIGKAALSASGREGAAPAIVKQSEVGRG